MAKENELDPGIWDRLFPFEPRRELAEKYVARLAELECVWKVFAMQVGNNDQKHQQRIFVVTTDANHTVPTVEDIDAVERVWLEVCPDQTSQKMLGYTPVLTESLFDYDRHELLQIRYREAIVLWQRSDPKATNKNSLPDKLNPHLN